MQRFEISMYLKNQCFLNFMNSLEFPAIEGGWTDWSSWGDCSSTCGAGRTSKYRTCTAPVQSGIGKHCEGEPINQEPCNNTECPGKSIPRHLIYL